MSVVVVIDRGAGARRKGHHDLALVAPVRLVGTVRGTRAARLVTVLAVLCAAVIAALGLTPSPGGRAGGGGAGATVASGPGLPVVPLGAVGPISAVLGRDLPGYGVVGLTATNAEQDLRAEFSSTGVKVVSGRLRLGLALVGYGYAGSSGALPALAPVAPVAGANRALYSYGPLSEWWANGPAGLEQGFTVSSRPGAGTGPLTFSLALSGTLRARLDGAGLYLSGPGGALVYDDLVATDARGAALPARFALGDGRALIEVDDRGAAYPLRVDPLVQQSGELISSDGTPSGEFGRSVAVSGNTVAVAADNQTVGSVKFEGAVYVFVEPAGGWAELAAQSAELLASWRPPPSAAATGYLNPPALGWALAMSGPTIVATSILTCNKWGPTVTSPCLNRGAAYVFVEPTTGWSGVLHQSALLTASDLSPGTVQLAAGNLGYSVAVAGGTVVVGAVDQHVVCADPVGCPPGGSTLEGAVYVYQQPAGGWSGTLTQSAELTPPSGVADLASFGNSGAVAVSGGTIVVGAGDEAYVFEAPTGGWSGQPAYAAQLTAPSGAGPDALGASVAVSGSTVVAGAPAQTVGPNTDQGAVFVYNEPAAGWSGTLSPAAELTASDGTRGNAFGTSVAVAGTTIAVAEGLPSPGGLKTVYLFSEPAAGWSGHLTESSELVASNEAVTDAFGSDIALSCTTVAVGAPGHHRLGSFAGAQGSAYVFAPPTTTGADGGPATAAAHSTTAASDSGRAHFPSGLAASGATPASSACALLVTDVTATSDPLSVDVHVSQDPAYSASSACDPGAAYRFSDAELASTTAIGACVFRLKFDQPGTGIYDVALEAADHTGKPLELSAYQYKDDQGQTITEEVDGKFPVVIASCRQPQQPGDDETGIDALANSNAVSCGVEIGPWDTDAASVPSEVLADMKDLSTRDLTAVPVESVDPSAWPTRDLVVAQYGYLPTGSGAPVPGDQYPTTHSSHVVAVVQRRFVPGGPPGEEWDGEGTKLTPGQLDAKPPATVISAHGAWTTPDGLVRVPAGDDITTFVPIGDSMLADLAIHVDTGNIVGRDRRYLHTYRPGDLVPNFVFGPLTAENYDGRIGKYGVKVQEYTTLNDLLRPKEGQVWISACADFYVPAGKSTRDSLSGLPVHVPGSTALAGHATVTLVGGQLQVSGAPPSP